MKKTLLFFAFLLIGNPLMAADSLTLYFIPSPTGMDWSSPSNLAWSALKNRISFKPRFMGHVFVEMKCGEDHELTGMVGKNFDYLRQLLIENRGLGILYHSFQGGLEDKASLQEELKGHFAEGRVNFARFIINEGQCTRLTQYLKEYRAQNVGRYYGLANRPLHGEGAGCSAFGVSFLEVAGLLSQDIKDGWSNSVNIPLKYAGPPLREEGVSLLKLMFNAGSWAKESEPHQKISFWDPDLMYKWVKAKLNKAGVDKSFTVDSIGKSQGVVFDHSYLPAPSGPIWQQNLGKTP